AARAVAEDAAERRGTEPAARPRSRSLGDCDAVSRTLDGGSDWLACARATPDRRGAIHRQRASRAAAVIASAVARGARCVGYGDQGIRRCAENTQSLARDCGTTARDRRCAVDAAVDPLALIDECRARIKREGPWLDRRRGA